MPTVGDVLSVCKRLDKADTEAARAAAPLRTGNADDPETWSQCRHCEDAKWQVHSCQGGTARTCGRPSKGFYDTTGKHSVYVGACQGPHTFARRCVCAA